jgi:hypothetical protein
MKATPLFHATAAPTVQSTPWLTKARQICGLLLLTFSPAVLQAQPADTRFTIARLQYQGGGDWYSDPSSLPNLLRFIAENTRIEVNIEETQVSIMDEELFSFPYIYMTGHGNISFTSEESIRLRQYLESGGFLHADDNYGMDESFRREMKRVFPKKTWAELPADHDLFNNHFNFPEGLPKIHQHDAKRPQALALFEGDRIIVLYTYETDLGDGWEDAHVHQDPESKRQAALRMGTNIVVWALTH